MVMASFDPAHVRHYYPAMQGVAQRLAGRWQAAADAGRPVELLPDLMRYTVDTIAGLAFGAEVNTLEAMLVAADLPDSGIDDVQVAGNVLTMLLAGEDTTANTLAWLLHLLWQHPEALAEAAAEVRRHCSWPPTMEQLAALDFVESCIHETRPCA
jgi:cytochrome P450